MRAFASRAPVRPPVGPYFRRAPGRMREEESLKSVGGLLCAGLALSVAPPLAAQDVLEPVFTDSPPVIDGRLDDDVWQGQEPVSGFRTYNPDYGVEMVADTHVFMAYDAGHLYFAFKAFDSEPDELRATVTARDNIFREDWVAVNLDTFGDQQSLYAFYSNPLGIQGDGRYASGNEDRNVDMVWYSDGRIDEDGYTVEMSIPVRSIRFAGTDPVRMGVIFERAIRRVSQSGTSPPLDPARAGQWLNQMRPISYRGIERGRVVEVLPAVTYSVDRANEAGRLRTAEEQGDLSLTAKYGLTSDLVLDATYNPDFSQVEADAGQVDVNLRYDLFFPEKRPFFLEGREHFGVAATSKSGSDPLRSVLYTRKIVDPITGAKLAGKIGDRHTVASIYAVDELPGEAAGGGTGYAHVPVLRYKRALSDDNYLGALYAGRETETRFNRLGGLDGYYRVSESGSVALHGFLSRTRSEPGSAVRGGHAVGARYGVASRDIDYAVAYTDISRDFRADMGFLMRTGVRQIGGEVRPKFYPGADWVRRISLDLSTTQTLDTESDRWETANQIGLSNLLFSTLTLTGGLHPFDRDLPEREVPDRRLFAHGDGPLLEPRQLRRGLPERVVSVLLRRAVPGPVAPHLRHARRPADAEPRHRAPLHLRRLLPGLRLGEDLRLSDRPRPPHVPAEPVSILPGNRRVQRLPAGAAHRLPRLLHLHPGHRASRRIRIALRADRMGAGSLRARRPLQRDAEAVLLQDLVSVQELAVKDHTHPLHLSSGQVCQASVGSV